MLLKNILPILIMLLLLASCKKESIPAYENDPRIYILSGNEVRYSFAIKNSSLEKDTVWVNVRIMGLAEGIERNINLAVVDSLTTAEEGLHYSLLNQVMPAGEYGTKLGVVVYRTPDLETKEVKLHLRVLPSEHFQPGIGNSLDFTLLINDILTKPANWESALQVRFGVYSTVKFRFMIDVLGTEVIQLITSQGVLPNQMLFYRQKVRNAWLSYEAANGPLIDENGSPVVFP